MAKTINRRLAELIDSNGQLVSGKISNGYISTDHLAGNSITQGKLHSTFALPASAIGALNTSNLSESGNLYYTNARADARIAAANTGDLTEGSNLYYLDSRVQTYLSGNRSYGNITTTGYLRGPASFTIDPAGHGDNSGTVVIAGNLQVDGTTTTINSTTVSIDDLNFTIASDAADSSAANGAGITIGGAAATMLYTHATTSFDFNKPINVTGAITSSGNISLGGTDGNNAVLSLTANTGNWVFTNVQASRNLEIYDSDGTGVALTIDTSANATFAGTISSGAITSTGILTLDTSPAANGTGDLKVIPSANSSSGVGHAGQIFGVNISSTLSSNSPKQYSTWGGVTGATAIALQADDSPYGQFQVWTAPQDSSANTVLTPRFWIAGNGNATFTGTLSSGAITTNNNFNMTGGYSVYLGSTSRFSSDNNGSFGINYGTTGGSSTGSLVIYNNTAASIQLNRNGTLASNISGNNTTGGNIILGPTANGISKWHAIVGRQYDSAETEGYSLITGASSSGVNDVTIGGGLDEQNAATKVMIKAAGNSTTRNGTEIVRVTTSGLDIRSNGLMMGGTTVIDSSRNVTGGNLYTGAGNEVRAYRGAGGNYYSSMSMDTGETMHWTNSYGGKKLSLTRDGHLQLSGTTVIDASRNLTNIASYNSYIPTASSSSTNSVVSLDSRSVNSSPSARNRGLYVDFKNQSTIGLTGSGTYAGVLTFRAYGNGTDLSGGYPIQIAYDDAGALQTRVGPSATAWNAWKAIHVAGNNLTAGAITGSGNLLLDSNNAEINLKSGVGTTSGAVNWTFNTTGTDYASIKLPYDTRATKGLWIDSGYPITVDATTRIDFDISGSTKMDLDGSGLSVAGDITTSGKVEQSTGQSHFFRGNDNNWRMGSDIVSDSGGLISGAATQMIVGGSADSYGFQIFGHQTSTSPCFEVIPNSSVAASKTNIRGNLYVANTLVIDSSRNITANTATLSDQGELIGNKWINTHENIYWNSMLQSSSGHGNAPDKWFTQGAGVTITSEHPYNKGFSTQYTNVQSAAHTTTINNATPSTPHWKGVYVTFSGATNYGGNQNSSIGGGWENGEGSLMKMVYDGSGSSGDTKAVRATIWKNFFSAGALTLRQSFFYYIESGQFSSGFFAGYAGNVGGASNSYDDPGARHLHTASQTWTYINHAGRSYLGATYNNASQNYLNSFGFTPGVASVVWIAIPGLTTQVRNDGKTINIHDATQIIGQG